MLFLVDYSDQWQFKAELIGRGQKEPRARQGPAIRNERRLVLNAPDMR